MKARLVRALRAADRRPVRTTLAVAALLYIGLLVWAQLADAPVLLARTDPADRARVYTQFTGAATALLATSLTVLSILIALPDRPAVEDLRGSPAWPRIQAFLLATAALCLISLVGSFVGSAADHARDGREWLSSLTTVAGAMSVLCILFAGVVFGLFLRIVNREDDPSRGRGAGTAD